MKYVLYCKYYTEGLIETNLKKYVRQTKIINKNNNNIKNNNEQVNKQINKEFINVLIV